MKKALIFTAALALGTASCDRGESLPEKSRFATTERDFRAAMECAKIVRERLKDVEIDENDPLFPEMAEVDSQVRDNMQRDCERYHRRIGDYPVVE